MKISIVSTLPEDQWRNYVDRHPDGNIFHTPEMFHVFEQVKGYRPELWAAVGENRKILALLLPVHISLSSGLLRRLTTRSILFGGVLVDPGQEGKEALAVLLEAYKKGMDTRSLFTEVRNVSSCVEYQPILNRAKFEYEDHLNYLIELGPKTEEVFNRIGHRTQRNIRHGINQAKVAISELHDRNELDVSYELLTKTYRMAQVPLADRSLFEAAYDVLMPKGMMLVTTALVGASPAATSVDLLYKDTMIGWYGGMDRAYSSYTPNELLMWHVLQLGCERGYRMYDFGGAGKPNEEYGVRQFKAKFGGNLVCYGRNRWVPNQALLAICAVGYEGLRLVLSKKYAQDKG